MPHLNHDKFPFPGTSIWPLLSKAQADFKIWGNWCLTTLVGYYTYKDNRFVYYCLTLRFKECTSLLVWLLTTEKRLQAEQFDFPLTLNEVGSSWIWSTGT